MTTIDEQDLVYRLRKRAEIRRQIKGRKSVQEGKPDRISNLLEEAAVEIDNHRKTNELPKLTRNQINSLHQLMQEYPDVDSVTIAQSQSSGIGTAVYATVKYAANREHTVDITDYASW